jgi:hypothetical protein
MQNGGGQGLENRAEVAGYGGGMHVRFKADVGGVEWQGAPPMHPEAAGGCEAREMGRVGSLGRRPRWWWGRCSEVMRSAQGGRKCFFFRLPLFAFGRLVGDIGWFSA